MKASTSTVTTTSFDIVFPHTAKPEPVSQVPVGPKNAPKFQAVDHRGARWDGISTFLNNQLW